METDYYFYAPDPDAINHHFFESAYEYQDYLASLLGEDETDEDTEETEKPADGEAEDADNEG